MSGPKVINIEAVRRRQRRESRMHLRRLQIALAEIERWQAQPQASSMLERLHAMNEAEQWEPLSIESGRLSSFYEEEVHRLRQQEAAERATGMRRAHRLQQSIAQMTSQLQGQPASVERDRLIDQLTSSDAATQQSALNAALYFIEQTQRGETTSRLRDLAAGLIDPNMTARTPAIPQAAVDPQQQRLEKCWSLLGELSALEDSPDIKTLSEKARHITTAPADQQALLLDSLALELSSHLQNRRAALALRHELELLFTDLEEVSSPIAAEWKQRLTVLAQSFALEQARQLAKEARAWIEQAIAEESRLEQRAAVLHALAATGYEVREGMAAAWVEHGRIVLRKPSESTYGVELSAPAQGSAVQTRVVALSNSPRDPQRDLEVEETWCGEFERARALLTEVGFNASLVQAHPAGAIPLKVASGPYSSYTGTRRQKPENFRQRKLGE